MIVINFIGTIYYYLTQVILFLVCTPIAFLIWIVVTPFDKQRKINHTISCIMGQLILFFNPYWKAKIHNKDKVNFDETYVIASNHQSLSDIVMLTGLQPLQFKYVSKKAINYIPLLGWIMSMASYVLLDRKDPKSQFKMMRTCEKYLKNNISVAIFPEGTRSKNGKLGRFKDGASLLSKTTNKPILPICMVGNNYSMPKKGFIWSKKVKMDMYVLDPIYPINFTTTKELTNAVKDAISKKLEEFE